MVVIDLTTMGGIQTGTGDENGDVLIAIENVIGSDNDDKLTGDKNANILEGGKGADTLDGGVGLDVASYASSAARRDRRPVDRRRAGRRRRREWRHPHQLRRRDGIGLRRQ